MKFGTVTTPNNVFLAPMAGVTDLPFRLICKEFGCGVVYTEMISAKGLLYKNERTNDLLYIDKKEHPAGIQLFGSDPDILREMAKLAAESDVDFIDINMGCPAPKITKNGEGSALMKNPELIGKIIYETARVLDKPLTVKIRKGFDENSVNAIEIAKIAEQAGASAIAVHGRTREQFYSGKADWDIIKAVKQSVTIPVIGNGDIKSPQDAKRMMDETHCDAVMIGRAAQGNPWLFRRTLHYLNTGEILDEPTFGERAEIILKHTRMLIDYKGNHIGIREMRSHLTSYVKGIHGASHMRKALTAVESYDDVKKLLDSCYDHF